MQKLLQAVLAVARHLLPSGQVVLDRQHLNGTVSHMHNRTTPRLFPLTAHLPHVRRGEPYSGASTRRR